MGRTGTQILGAHSKGFDCYYEEVKRIGIVYMKRETVLRCFKMLALYLSCKTRLTDDYYE